MHPAFTQRKADAPEAAWPPCAAVSVAGPVWVFTAWAPADFPPLDMGRRPDTCP